MSFLGRGFKDQSFLSHSMINKGGYKVAVECCSVLCVCTVAGDHSPVSCQSNNPNVVLSAAQQGELCIWVAREEVEGSLQENI